MSSYFSRPGEIVETSKHVQILDKFGMVRYSVKLDEENGQYTVRAYLILIGGTEKLVEETLPVLREAEKLFRRTVDTYKALVEAESVDPRSMKVYAKRIGYHKVFVRCCANCKYVRPLLQDCCISALSGVKPSGKKYVCCNDGMLDPLRKADAERLGVKLSADFRPVVGLNCVCDGYENPRLPGRRAPSYRNPIRPYLHPDQQDEIARYIEQTISSRVGEVGEALSAVTVSAINDSISSISQDMTENISEMVTEFVMGDIDGRISDAKTDVINTISSDIEE